VRLRSAGARSLTPFGNKEGLVRACLEAPHDGTTGRLIAAVDRYRDPRRRVLAVFQAQAEIFAQPGFRGCAFAAAVAVAPRGGLIEQAATDHLRRRHHRRLGGQ
jgi:AcrR family transcriptional regulator